MFANFVNNAPLMGKIEEAAQQVLNHISTIRQANVPIEGVLPPHVREAISMMENRIGEIVAWSQGMTLTFETHVRYLDNEELLDRLEGNVTVIRNNAEWLKNITVSNPDLLHKDVADRVNSIQQNILNLQGLSQGYSQ